MPWRYTREHKNEICHYRTPHFRSYFRFSFATCQSFIHSFILMICNTSLVDLRAIWNSLIWFLFVSCPICWEMVLEKELSYFFGLLKHALIRKCFCQIKCISPCQKWATLNVAVEAIILAATIVKRRKKDARCIWDQWVSNQFRIQRSLFGQFWQRVAFLSVINA